jgi:hypothetical protein
MTLKNFLKSIKSDAKPNKLSVGGTLEKFGVFELTKPVPHQPPTFCIRKKNAPLAYASETHDNTFTYNPITKVPWELPTEPQAYTSNLELWNEVKQCIYDHVDLADSKAYDVLTAWVFASWQLERFSIAPYLFFYGSFGTGKTRALEVLSKLCSRGWLALYVTPANLYRPLEDWKPTLFLDEAETYGDKHDILGLLNGSYRKGQYVPRQKETDGDYTTEFYDCFAFKAIAGTKDLAKTLRSRCIIFQTSHASRKIKFFIDEQQTTQLRNKLLKWRFDRTLEDIEHFEDVLKRCEGLVETIGNQREVELFYPLLSIAPNKEIENELIEYAKTSASRKLEELSLTTEATCLTAIFQAKERGLMKNGKLLISDITATANENLSFDEQWKERQTSSHCSRLGFQKARGTQGKACIIWSEPLIERLKKDQRYKACFTIPPSETPSNSSKSSNTSQNPDWLNTAVDTPK